MRGLVENGRKVQKIEVSDPTATGTMGLKAAAQVGSAGRASLPAPLFSSDTDEQVTAWRCHPTGRGVMSIEQGDVARAMSTDNPLIMRQFTAEAPISLDVWSPLFKNMSEPAHVSDLLDGKLFCTRVDILRSRPHPAGDDEEGVFKSVIVGRIVDEEPVIGKPVPMANEFL